MTPSTLPLPTYFILTSQHRTPPSSSLDKNATSPTTGTIRHSSAHRDPVSIILQASSSQQHPPSNILPAKRPQSSTPDTMCASRLTANNSPTSVACIKTSD
ncbi:hypothetical protein C8Q76DRAFT_789071 [Earliella scabrosa]|nr:hypothetical protein C8Q76DRAFT_789071 [Earliella scabrosa]